jgi:hypothetical protein
VSGRNFASQLRAAGGVLIGNSDPATNHGTIAIAGTRAMYYSCLGTRLASVSAIAYMATPSSSAAANQSTPAPVALKSMPQQRGRDQRHQLEAGDRERDQQVGEHEQRTGDRRREQLTLGAAVTIDDRAQPGETSRLAESAGRPPSAT